LLLFPDMAVLLALASFAAIAAFTPGSLALESSDMLMRDAKNATELFEIAKKDMENWLSTYLKAIKEFRENLLPDYVCPDVSARLQVLTELEEQIEKIRECRQEKFEQLDVLKGIADTLGSLNKTESLKKLEDTIEHLNKTAHAEDIELKKEEDVVMKLKVTIKEYKCDCTYNHWGHWGSCSQTCGKDGIMSRSRDVKWQPRNGGEACLKAEMESVSECNKKCCPIDCTWEEWGEWSACPDECGVSKVSRSREKNEHECGGLACTGLSTDEKICDRHAQMKMENDQCQQNLSNITVENKRLREKIIILNYKLCQNVLCHNGGTCQEGECMCDDGSSGSTCAEKDIIWATGFEKSNMVTTIDRWGPDFEIYFKLKVNKMPNKIPQNAGWYYNVLQMVTGRQNVPGVYLFVSNGKPFLQTSIGKVGNAEGDFELELNKVYTVLLTHEPSNWVGGTFKVTVDGSVLLQHQTGITEPFTDVKYYLSNPWSRSAGDLAQITTPLLASPQQWDGQWDGTEGTNS